MANVFELDWLLTLTSMFALLLLTRGISSIHECPRLVIYFLRCQCAFAFAMLLVGTKWKGIDRWYSIIFGISMIPAVTMALGLAAQCLNLAKMKSLIIVMLVLCGLLGKNIGDHWGKADWAYRLNGFLGAGLLSAGIFMLISMDRWLSPVMDKVRLILGLFLLTEGLVFWMLPEYFAKSYESAKHTNTWLQPFIATGAFLWLGYSLAHAKVTP